MSEPAPRLFACNVAVRLWKKVYVVARTADEAEKECLSRTSGNSDEIISDVKDEDPDTIEVTDVHPVESVEDFENRGTVYFADSCDDVASYAKPREWATRTAKVLADEAKAERDAAANVPLPLTLAEVFE